MSVTNILVLCSIYRFYNISHPENYNYKIFRSKYNSINGWGFLIRARKSMATQLVNQARASTSVYRADDGQLRVINDFYGLTNFSLPRQVHYRREYAPVVFLWTDFKRAAWSKEYYEHPLITGDLNHPSETQADQRSLRLVVN